MSDIFSFEDEQENEFRGAVNEMSMYQGDQERTTLDGEWSESELKSNVYDECHKLLADTDKYKYKALKDRDLLKAEYMTEKICEDNDLIEIYNTEYNKNRESNQFGIHYFDTWIISTVGKILKENIVSR